MSKLSSDKAKWAVADIYLALKKQRFTSRGLMLIRSRFGIILVSTIGFICGCNQVDDQKRNDISLIDKLGALRVQVAEIRHQIYRLRADIQKLQPTQAPTARQATKRPPPDTTVYQIAMGDSPVLGAKEAAVTIVEFGDFQCPYCAREYPKIKQILQEYPDQVRFVFKHYPLRFHKKAPPAHAATELARREKGPEAFWKMQDLIMANPKKLEISDLRDHAKTLNLDLQQFDTVMADAEKINELLKADLVEAKKCKVRATPTVLINGLKMTNRTLAGYQTRINQLLKKEVAVGN